VNSKGITEKDFKDWLQNPCTEAYKEFIETQVAIKLEIVANGGCMAGNGFSHVGQLYITNMNTINIYKDMLEDLQDYNTIVPQDEEIENDSESSESSGRQDTP
jgi:hypothetical protein